MKIIIVPRIIIERFKASPQQDTYNRYGNWCLISISTTEEEKVKQIDTLKHCGCVDYLQLVFSDIIKPYKDYIVFNEEMAKQSLDFVNKHKDLNLMIIHCDAGISRSGAFGYFFNKYLNLDDEEFKRTNPNIHPNSLVIETMNKVSGITVDLQKLYDEIFSNLDLNGGYFAN